MTLEITPATAELLGEINRLQRKLDRLEAEATDTWWRLAALVFGGPKEAARQARGEHPRELIEIISTRLALQEALLKELAGNASPAPTPPSNDP